MRHPRAHRPGPGQESVWDYPRPPALERTSRRIRVRVGGKWLVDSTNAWRVLETSHPPVYYVPRQDVAMGLLEPAEGASFCEWKGRAVYWDAVVEGQRRPRVAWSYPEPTPGFEPIRDHLAFYLPALDEGWVDGERARPQPGNFYGGWVTPDLAGPFKGEAGSAGW